MQHASVSARENAPYTPSAGEFGRGVARAFAGSLIFALPMLMTMEMWWLGFHADPARIALLLAATFPLLVALSRVVGFRQTVSIWDDVADALVAVFVAAVAALLVLSILGLLTAEMSARELIGKVVVQVVPGSIGALLARSQFGSGDEDLKAEKRDPTYPEELFLMAVGALFLSFNLAPTEEMVLIAYLMSPWQEIGLVLLSLFLMHLFVYAANFRGGSPAGEGREQLGLFARFTVVGYVLVVAISLGMLWIFGRLEGLAAEEVLSAGVVLAFPGSIGAAAARLIL